MSILSIIKKVLLPVMAASLILVSTVAAAPYSPIDPPIPDETAGQDSQPITKEARMERVYQRRLQAQDRQTKMLEKGDNLVEKAEAIITKMESKGKDVTVLKQALEKFKSAIIQIETYHAMAKAALDTHTGFDASGKVTDATQAEATLKTVIEAQKQFRTAGRQAIKDLRLAIREFRQKNKPQGEPTPGTS